MKYIIRIPLLAVVEVDAPGPDAAIIKARRTVTTDLKYTTHEYRFDGDPAVGEEPVTRIVPPAVPR